MFTGITLRYKNNFFGGPQHQKVGQHCHIIIIAYLIIPTGVKPFHRVVMP